MPERPPPAIAFITGCGRSGTTILGKMLTRHADIAVLNDAFDLWVAPFPITDVWRRSAPRGASPKIVLDESDAAAAAPEDRARFLASLDEARGGKRVLVEKLAINNFRLGFLAGLCPGAVFINILRDGAEVAMSIARRAAAGRWYGRGDAKWPALTDLARARGLGALVERCDTDLARGLLEWRLSVEAAEEFRARRPDLPWLQLRYETLLENPVGTARAVTDFLGLPPGPYVERFAAAQVKRQTPEPDGLPPEVRAIASDVLDRMGYPAEVRA